MLLTMHVIFVEKKFSLHVVITLLMPPCSKADTSMLCLFKLTRYIAVRLLEVLNAHADKIIVKQERRFFSHCMTFNFTCTSTISLLSAQL